MTFSTLPIQLPAPFTYRDLHEDILKQAIPAWLTDLSPSHRATLGKVQLALPPWYKNASPQEHERLKHRVSAAWKARIPVDRAMASLKSPEDFGAPLLQQRLGIENDVRTTFLRLYIPQSVPWFPLRTGGARTRTVSLLDAALHNFEKDERYEASSGFITQPTPSGHFDSLPALDRLMSVAQFTALCRELDLGGQYQRYLQAYFDEKNPVAADTLQRHLKQHHLADLNVALQMARMKLDLLDAQTYQRLQALLDAQGRRDSCAPLLAYELSIMSSPLSGIVLFAEDLERPHPVSVTAYIPDDPHAPLKQYPTLVAFMTALGNHLRSTEYQQFFSRFVNHAERGDFFAHLNQRLSRVTWHPHTRGDPRPSWRETPVERPRLMFSATPIKGDLFKHLFQKKLSKVYNDGRSRAVPTARVDQKARWERWDILEKVASQVLQIAAFIAAPFVPPVGLLMLAYSAYQMLDEVIEGVIDWTAGQTREGFEHLFSFVEQVLQLGTFAVGGHIATSVLRTALPVTSVKFFDSLKPVTLPDGKARLWQPDLEPYAHDIRLGKTAYPDAEGLHSHSGVKVLMLADKPYVVQTDPVTGQPYLHHPTRPNAYRPPLMSNGKGAWLTELDTPWNWDETTLMRRQGPHTHTLNDQQLANIRHISDTHEGALRSMHLNQHKPPPLLTDTLERFKIDQALQDFIDQMNSDDAAVYAKADAQTQLQLLTDLGLWPQTKTLRVIDAEGKTVWEMTGNENASVAQLHEAQLKNGDLLNNVLEALDEPQRKTLLGEAFGDPVTSVHTRAGKLRKKLAGLAELHRRSLFDSRYQNVGDPSNARQQLLIDTTVGLPRSASEALLDGASGLELKEVDQGTVPARLRELAQALRDEARVTRAYEGLYLQATDNLDTHRLALHSLQRLPGWPKRLRLEIRHPDTTLIDAIGKPRARLARVLERSPEGRYTPRDEKGPVFGETDFYTAVLQALPDAERNAVNLHIGQGSRLKQTLRTHALERSSARKLITAQPAPRPTDTRTHLRLLGMEHYPPADTGAPEHARSLARRLFPAQSDEQLDNLLTELERSPGGARVQLAAMRDQYAQLGYDLNSWVASTARRYPGSEITLSRQDYADAVQSRRLFMQEILRGWRQETPTDRYFEPPARNGLKIIVNAAQSGELPTLRMSFEHVSYLELKGDLSALNADGFLRSFPRLRHLSITDAALGHLPPAVSHMPNLNALILSNCSITLNADSLNTLAALNRLRTLDLFRNPLALAPSVETMVDLQYLELSQTRLSQFPAGLINRPALEMAGLSNNRITQLPAEFFTLPEDTLKNFDLSGNPLSRDVLEQAKAFYQRTGLNWQIDAPATEVRQVKQLFPAFTDAQVNRYIFGLPGTLEMGQIELARLEAEYADLSTRLDTWAGRADTTAQQSRRQQLVGSLKACWRREVNVNHSSSRILTTYALEILSPIGDEFPPLEGQFDHVSQLRLVGADERFPLQSSLFFKGFPALNDLSIEGYNVGDMPDAIFELPQLSSLSLHRCSLTLSDRSTRLLSTLNDLKQLNLSQNPLGQTPDFGAMPTLTEINLADTQLKQFPDGLLTAIERLSVNLSGNQIVKIPDSAFQLSTILTDAFDLSRNPLSRATLMQIKAYCQRTGEDFGADAPAALRDRIKALYPTFSEARSNRFFFELPGDLDAAEPAIEALEQEYEQMRTDLQEWAIDTPEHHPVQDEPLDLQTRAQDQLNRQAFKQLLEQAWRRETAPDDDNLSGRSHILTFNQPIIGELPHVNARLEHVTVIDLEGAGTTTGVNGLLKCVPKLQQLILSKFRLGDIPTQAFNLPELNTLILIDSQIVLTPASNSALSGLQHLQYLDLSGNPLGRTPDVRHVSLLESLYLQETGINQIPEGMFSLRELRVVDLSDNLIEDMPAALFELRGPLESTCDLSGNPWSARSLNHLRQYYLQTGNDLNVEAVHQDAAGNPVQRPVTPEPMEQ